MNTPYLKITRKSASQSVSAVLATAALMGQMVQLTGTAGVSLHEDATGAALHTGAAGKNFMLRRTVLNATEQPLEGIVFGNTEVNPVLVNKPVELIQVEEIEAEGGDTALDGLADYVLVTAGVDAQKITSGTAAGTLLTLKAGKWAIITDKATQAVAGKLIKQLTPVDAGNVRIGIEVYAEARLDTIV